LKFTRKYRFLEDFLWGMVPGDGIEPPTRGFSILMPHLLSKYDIY